MTRICRSTAGAAGLAVLMLLPATGLAGADHSSITGNATELSSAAEARLAHMSGPAGGPGMMAPGEGYAPFPCQNYQPGYGVRRDGMSPGMTGPGTMGPGMMRPGMMDPGGMMGGGMMGGGMMGGGMMGGGMMGGGMMGGGMMGPGFDAAPGFQDRIMPSRDLTVDDVRHFLEHRIEMHGNKRLKIGDVQAADDHTIIADITTVDGSLVQRLEVDRHTGQTRSVEE